MPAYKQYANIDAQGTLILQNLPYRNQQFVEVVVLIKEYLPKPMNINKKLARLKASFGTINTSVQIPDKALSRENLYGEDGR